MKKEQSKKIAKTKKQLEKFARRAGAEALPEEIEAYWQPLQTAEKLPTAAATAADGTENKPRPQAAGPTPEKTGDEPADRGS
jgi:hypothetical protein